MTPRKLVGAKISGGLGNQLFQYATARALAERLGGDLRLDLRSFQGASERRFALPAFGVEIREWVPKWWRLEELARNATRGWWRPGPEPLFDNEELEPRFFAIQTPCFLRGYFQSWRYLVGYEDVIRRMFDTTPLSTGRTAHLEHRILTDPCAVMVHIRRGDYGGTAFPLLERGHYQRARERLEAEAPRPTYYLFSDDIEQATALLSDWPDLVVVGGNSELEDFRLMSLCRHHIIANSTFSWWAAWLGRATDKIVIAPRLWYGPGFPREVDLDVRLPPEWIRV
jgi:hypothetical protein